MKCRICGIEYSNRVLKIHETICKNKLADKKDVIEIVKSSNSYSLSDLKKMAIADEKINHAPSTINRWKELRLKKELGIE